MKFSIIHPTARVTPDFEHPWWKAALSALLACDSPHDVEYILVVHSSRIVDFYDAMRDRNVRVGGFARFTVVTNYGRDCLVDQCNAGALAMQGEIVLGNQDDMRYAEHWDSWISDLIPDTSKLVCVQTPGPRPDLLTIPTIATKTLLDAIGPISPEYDGMFSDDEWSIKARQLGTVIQSNRSSFEHLHPVYHKGAVDSVYAQENRDEAYRVGRRVFERRKAQGFPRVVLPGFPAVNAEDRRRPAEMAMSADLAENGVEEHRQGGLEVVRRAFDWIDRKLTGGPVETIPAAPAPRFISLCLPGESFHFHWQKGLVQLCAALGEDWQIKLCFGYTSSCYSTRIHLAQDVIDGAREVRPEYVFWLDDDNIIKPADFLRMVAFLDARPDVDVLAGWCWIAQKTSDPKLGALALKWGTSIGNFWKEDGVHLCPLELSELFRDGGAPQAIEHTGFPGVLMRYSVLEKLGAACFRPVVKADLPELLKGIPVTKEVTDEWFAGEDGAFCLRARAAGLTLYVDPLAKLAHLKFLSQEPDIQLFRDTPQELKDWRAQVNGPAIKAPENFEEVIS